MSRLNTKIGSIEFINPFILASGPPARTGEMMARAFKTGWAGAVTKTICLNYRDMIDVSPRLAEVSGGGIKNIELISPRTPEQWVEDIKFLKRNYPDNIVIASISAEADNPAAWQKLTLMMQEARADIIELNFSCPHGLPEMEMGTTCSDTPEFAGQIIKSIKQVSKIPVWAKLSPNVSSIKYLAEVCIQNKADGITAINTVKGFAGVDIETGKPKLSVIEDSTYGGLSGKIIKPIALKAVSEIASSFDCPVSASGGITSWQDGVEFILLGASTLQVCTEVMLSGFEIIDGLKESLNKYLLKHNINSIDEIRRSSLKYIKSYSALDNSAVSIPEINYDKCVKCSKCYKACSDAGYQAITNNEGNLPQINKQKCTGCGLCKIACPVDCIIMNLSKNIISHTIAQGKLKVAKSQ